MHVYVHTCMATEELDTAFVKFPVTELQVFRGE